MSDLCYNCFDCHLPRPCQHPLKTCEICQSQGHAYTFCPLGVRKKEPYYQFWALCHNCDSWHLPDPCPLPFHTCAQCGHGGHLEYFCPVKPLSRSNPSELIVTQEDAKTGTKRQRTNGSDFDEKVTRTAAAQTLPADQIRRVEVETARRVIELKSRGYHDQDIIQHFERAPIQSPYGQTFIALSPGDMMFKTENLSATPSTNVSIGLPPPITPFSTGVYAAQNERFSSDELTRNLNSSYQSLNAANPSFKQMVNTPVPSKKSTRTNVACADCKNAKKRCVHMGNDATDLLQSTPLHATVPSAEAKFQPQETQSNQEWTSTFTNTTTAPVLSGGATDISASSNLTDPVNSMQGLDKAKISLLLNSTHESLPQQGASQVDVTKQKQFTDRIPSTSDTGASNELPNLSDKIEGHGATPIPVQKSPTSLTTPETDVFIIAPNVTEHPAHEQVQESTEEPNEEAKTQVKPKKGRGRPKRKT